MNCPACLTAQLAPSSLEESLASSKCEACGGNWIRGSEYWSWLARHGENLPEREEQTPGPSAPEPVEPRSCPECRSLMFRYKVGHGLGFTLDQCAACKGIWFDRDEWEALRARNLHDDINAVFTAPWQAAASREERRRRLEAMYVNKFGAGDYAEIKRVRAWLDAHPRRHELLAYLTDRDPLSA